jgi:chromosome segregation ATPase
MKEDRQTLRSLSDEELVSMARTRDELIASPLEQELGERLARAIDGHDDEIEDLKTQVRDLDDQLGSCQSTANRLEDQVADLERKLEDIKDIINGEST